MHYIEFEYKTNFIKAWVPEIYDDIDGKVYIEGDLELEVFDEGDNKIEPTGKLLDEIERAAVEKFAEWFMDRGE